jgi:histone H3/H4
MNNRIDAKLSRYISKNIPKAPIEKILKSSILRIPTEEDRGFRDGYLHIRERL